MAKRISSSATSNNQSQHSKGHLATQSKSTKPGILSIFDKEHKWDDKDEVLDAIYWYRQILALITGIIWGILGLYGITGMILFAIVNSIAAFTLANQSGYDFDPDDNFLCVKDGFMTTFATFLVSWTVTYTAVHFSHL